jgi:hypothetical protein
MMPGYEPLSLSLPRINLHTYIGKRPWIKSSIVKKVLDLVDEKSKSPISSINVDLANLDGDENFTALKFRMTYADGEKKERTFNIESNTSDSCAAPSSISCFLVEGEPARIW